MRGERGRVVPLSSGVKRDGKQPPSTASAIAPTVCTTTSCLPNPSRSPEVPWPRGWHSTESGRTCSPPVALWARGHSFGRRHFSPVPVLASPSPSLRPMHSFGSPAYASPSGPSPKPTTPSKHVGFLQAAGTPFGGERFAGGEPDVVPPSSVLSCGARASAAPPRHLSVNRGGALLFGKADASL
jgi:hypothetical protein